MTRVPRPQPLPNRFKNRASSTSSGNQIFRPIGDRCSCGNSAVVPAIRPTCSCQVSNPTVNDRCSSGNSAVVPAPIQPPCACQFGGSPVDENSAVVPAVVPPVVPEVLPPVVPPVQPPSQVVDNTNQAANQVVNRVVNRIQDVVNIGQGGLGVFRLFGQRGLCAPPVNGEITLNCRLFPFLIPNA